MKKHHSLEDKLFYLGIGCMAGVLLCYVLLPYLPLPPCPLYTYLGLYCPGCGGTRAIGSLLHGHILQSLWYHPLVPYSALLFCAFMLSQLLARLTRRRYFQGLAFHNWYLYAAGVILGVNWILKNVLLLVWGISL